MPFRTLVLVLNPLPFLSALSHPTTAKADRLKQARAEADREIAAFKATREEAYQRALAEVRQKKRGEVSSQAHGPKKKTARPLTPVFSPLQTQSAAASGETADRLAAQAAADVKAVEAQSSARAGGVVDALLAHVTRVQAGTGRA